MTHHPPPSSPRPDWRDPDMPVQRTYHMRDGTTHTAIDPAYESRYRAARLAASSQPTFHHDPTYNLRRPRT